MILESLLLPPGINLILMLIGLLIHHWWKWPGRIILAVSLIFLYLISLPILGNRQLFLLQNQAQFIEPEQSFPSETTIVVVLSSFKSHLSPEYQDENAPSPATLQKLRYANYLAKHLQLPLLLSGGLSENTTTPEAVLMNQIMIEEYQQPVAYLESQSENLAQQADLVSRILKEHHISTMVLITQSWQMRRAVRLFSQTGMVVYPAGVGFVQQHPKYPHFLTPYLPSAQGLDMNVVALKEYAKEM
ncbi:MAG: hypothetical protein COW84_01425 [Gammaproteobacteria bacterium CG22_combo_CG10-13_8_21_14_all_40_8]|nr:MAG: hypothetical protein COW84_01425 [Gammaproteobacteria bacterium CG22_combo_CG10-13_8_21_14_all_40_8]